MKCSPAGTFADLAIWSARTLNIALDYHLRRGDFRAGVLLMRHMSLSTSSRPSR